MIVVYSFSFATSNNKNSIILLSNQFKIYYFFTLSFNRFVPLYKEDRRVVTWGKIKPENCH